jgi:hypothetical protein
VQINGREYRIKKRTIQIKWQHRAYKTKENKAKTKHNMFWTPLYANKDKSYGTQNIWTHNMITQKSKRISNTDPTRNPG